MTTTPNPNSAQAANLATPEASNESEPELTLSNEQQAFIDAILASKTDKDTEEEKITQPNILLLGKAGVGKSTATREACNAADKIGMGYILAAPTGVAAININGQTVHRLISSLDRGIIPASSLYSLGFLLIDEVSMLRADLFDQLNVALQRACLDARPFGGLRLVLVGDPGQLPPVLKSGDAETEYIKANYLTPYFFSAYCYSKATWQVLELNQVFRQKDNRFPKLLNLIREGSAKKPNAYLNKFRRVTEAKGVILTARNADAESINAVQLAKLPGESTTYKATIQGSFKRNEHPADEVLMLRPGARAMCIKNIYEQLSERSSRLVLVNGDIVEVLECDYDCVKVFCERTEETLVLSKEDGIWEKRVASYDKETKKLQRKIEGQFMQIPLRLAWAITIHKSQGATIEELTIDFRKPFFAAGQAYVALSRGVSLESLWILGRIRESDVKVCKDVQAFLADHDAGVGIKPGSEWEQISEALEQSQSGADEEQKKAKQEEEQKAFAEMFGE